MDLTQIDGVWIAKVDMIQSLAVAIVTYYFGGWLKTKVTWLRKLSVSAPLVGGILVAVILSILDANHILQVKFDSTLQTQLMLAFFTTIGLMASLKLVKRLVKRGGKMLLFFYGSEYFSHLAKCSGDECCLALRFRCSLRHYGRICVIDGRIGNVSGVRSLF